MERRGGREPAGPLTHTCAALAAVMDCGETRGEMYGDITTISMVGGETLGSVLQ